MESEEFEHLEELKRIYQKRLRILEKQAAAGGSVLAPSIQIEIEETQRHIAEVIARSQGKEKPFKEIRSFNRSVKVQDFRWLSGLILSGIVIVIAVMLYGAISKSNNPSIINSFSETIVPIAVDSTKDWQSTGIIINKGDRVHIKVVGGKWTIARYVLSDSIKQQLPEDIKKLEIWVNNSYEQDGSGYSRPCIEQVLGLTCPLPNSKGGILVGRLGISEPFEVGDVNTVTAFSDGILYLRI
jgi:hypothetical protein